MYWQVNANTPPSVTPLLNVPVAHMFWLEWSVLRLGYTVGSSSMSPCHKLFESHFCGPGRKGYGYQTSWSQSEGGSNSTPEAMGPASRATPRKFANVALLFI